MILGKITISFMTMAFAWTINKHGMSISRNIKHDLCEALRNNVFNNPGISKDL